MGKSTISMVIFHSYFWHNQRVASLWNHCQVAADITTWTLRAGVKMLIASASNGKNRCKKSILWYHQSWYTMIYHDIPTSHQTGNNRLNHPPNPPSWWSPSTKHGLQSSLPLLFLSGTQGGWYTNHGCVCIKLYPIGSMYAIYGNIYHQYTPNVSIYTSTMDPMGITVSTLLEFWIWCLFRTCCVKSFQLWNGCSLSDTLLIWVNYNDLTVLPLVE